MHGMPRLLWRVLAQSLAASARVLDHWAQLATSRLPPARDDGGSSEPRDPNGPPQHWLDKVGDGQAPAHWLDYIAARAPHLLEEGGMLSASVRQVPRAVPNKAVGETAPVDSPRPLAAPAQAADDSAPALPPTDLPLPLPSTPPTQPMTRRVAPLQLRPTPKSAPLPQPQPAARPLPTKHTDQGTPLPHHPAPPAQVYPSAPPTPRPLTTQTGDQTPQRLPNRTAMHFPPLLAPAPQPRIIAAPQGAPPAPAPSDPARAMPSPIPQVPARAPTLPPLPVLPAPPVAQPRPSIDLDPPSRTRADAPAPQALAARRVQSPPAPTVFNSPRPKPRRMDDGPVTPAPLRRAQDWPEFAAPAPTSPRPHSTAVALPSGADAGLDHWPTLPEAPPNDPTPLLPADLSHWRTQDRQRRFDQEQKGQLWNA